MLTHFRLLSDRRIVTPRYALHIRESSQSEIDTFIDVQRAESTAKKTKRDMNSL